ncbi:type III polyketide synthase [Rouxiella badensis]|uniref:3,5-dihydroxyphenylacetyl-CoA synthase DpgA n=1 Tax=Rouxiella badensis TaxID=1646377 RepID=UPI001D154ADD|nr:3,5-dihydroxyphenylacetyl-CoA synthase DpgA [Rouxiella badensis]MCC3701801.1 type III polyketide synthase [Rouxiella badensis]
MNINTRDSHAPYILACAHDVPETSYTQHEVCDNLGIKDGRIRSIFINSGISKRHLSIKEMAKSEPNAESHGEMLNRHEYSALELGANAINKCLTKIGKTVEDIACICCVTSTGFLVPALSARFCQSLGLSEFCNRIDIVGMGCSAGLNGLDAVKNWSVVNPGKLAIVVCTEICSAAYLEDGTIATSVVNSLFGDGASAAVVVSEPADKILPAGAVRLLDKLSLTESEGIGMMKFDWNDEQHKNSFYLSKDVPYVVGSKVEKVINRLLGERSLSVSDIDHWIVHSGGKKVIDSICINLGLTKNDLRHTRSVLNDFGNLSSGSFLFSLERLQNEKTANKGDLGVLMTMGPGAAIETALVQWAE